MLQVAAGGKLRPRRRDDDRQRQLRYGVKDVGEYFDRLRERSGAAINVATLIGHNTILKAVKGGGARRSRRSRWTRRRRIVDQAMRDGAVGMSTGLIYRPGMYCRRRKSSSCKRSPAKYGGIYASHMRHRRHGDSRRDRRSAARRPRGELPRRNFALQIAESTSQAASAARRRRSAKCSGRPRGQEVWLDQYPYTASSTSITTMLPDWVYDKGDDAAKKRLNDPEQVKKILADMKKELRGAHATARTSATR